MSAESFYENDKFKDYYSILQVDKNAEPEVISFAYKALAKKNHPDMGGEAEKMKLINEAYDVLSNPELKSEYDLIYEEEKLSKKKDEEYKHEYYTQNTGYAYQTNANPYKEPIYEEPVYEENIMEYSDISNENESYISNELIEMAVKENLSDNMYEVNVKEFGFSIPNYCACCLDKPDGQINVKYKLPKGYALFDRYSSLLISFPICKACKKHIREYRIKRFIFIILSLFPAAVTSFWIFTNIPDIKLTTILTIVTILIAVSTSLVNKLIKMTLIEDCHANRGISAGILNSTERGTTFWFYNWLYAKTFAEENNSHVVCTGGQRDSRSPSLLSGGTVCKLFAIASFIMIIIIIATWMCIGFIKEIPDDFKKNIQFYISKLLKY